MALVIFDLDRTITRFGTYTPFLLYYAATHNPLRLLTLPIVLLLMIAYKCRLLSRGQLKIAMLTCFVGRPKKDTFLLDCDQFVEWVLQKHSYPAALERIAQHQAQGDKLMLATASYDFYAASFAKKLGLHHLVATRAVWRDAHLAPGIDGENCYGTEKLTRVNKVLKDMQGVNGTTDLIFYTDHHTDIPLLAKCTEAYAVNPTKKLRLWANDNSHCQILHWQ